jgi:hypothetical protein
MRRSHLQFWILALAVAAPLAVCCAKPLPDPDGNPGGARNLPLNVKHSDQLACQDRRAPDCTDWYVVRLPSEGEIRLEVTATSSEGLTPDYVVTIADDRADPLQSASNRGRREVQMTWSGASGAYFVGVGSGAQQSGLHYDIAVRYQPPHPEDPEEEVKTTSWMVLEVESEGGQPRYVVIDGGSKSGLQEGFPGRLIEGDRSIAEIEIVEVFDEGSRARITTELEDQITSKTAAEIDVPVGGAP